MLRFLKRAGFTFPPPSLRVFFSKCPAFPPGSPSLDCAPQPLKLQPFHGLVPYPLSPCYNLPVPLPDSATRRELVVSATDSGTRHDRFVAAQCPALSRTRVQELIESGLVLIDGKAASKGALHLRRGQKITVEITERPPIVAAAESIPLDVLYEDDDVIVINKAAGMTVHAGAGNVSGTLVNALLGRGQALAQAGDPLRPRIVHRLD